MIRSICDHSNLEAGKASGGGNRHGCAAREGREGRPREGCWLCCRREFSCISLMGLWDDMPIKTLLPRAANRRNGCMSPALNSLFECCMMKRQVLQGRGFEVGFEGFSTKKTSYGKLTEPSPCKLSVSAAPLREAQAWYIPDPVAPSCPKLDSPCSQRQRGPPAHGRALQLGRQRFQNTGHPSTPTGLPDGKLRVPKGCADTRSKFVRR